MNETVYEILKKLIDEHPNDYNLGSAVRRLVIEREIELSMSVINILESKNETVQ